MQGMVAHPPPGWCRNGEPEALGLSSQEPKAELPEGFFFTWPYLQVIVVAVPADFSL